MQKMIAFSFVIGSLAVGTASASEGVCAGSNSTSIVWHPTSWPSQHFIENKRINYLGRCDSMAADSAKGTVTVSLADASQADVIRCKYEVAGLGELRGKVRPDSSLYRKTARKVLETCGVVVKGTTDAGLAKSWR